MIQKYNASKRLLSLLLAVVMCLTMLPTSALAATEVPALDSQGFVTYTDGVIQYVKYDNYLYKVTYTNLQNIEALYLYEEYGYLRINIPEGMMELLHADSYTRLKASELPKTVGGTLNCYNYGERVIDENAPVVIITCVAVNEPTWSWASDHSSATAVFTAKEADIFVTLSADASFVATACSEGDQITYTASVTFNGNTYTDQQEVIKPHDWIRQEGPTCVQICSRCGTTQTDAHIYDNACDTDCNNCGATRETDHAYDNACDTDCNNCGATREAGHHYDSDCDSECNSCGVSRETTIAHTYDYVCDQDCNACGEVRDAFHNVEDGACTYCGMRYYGVLVAGVQITGENASDVLGDGTISFDVATNTLTLNGATVNMTETNLAIHESTQQEHKDRIKNGESFEPYFNPLTPALQITDGEVTLVLQGENTLIGLDYWILGSDIFESLRYGVPAVTIADGASLTVTGDDTATLTLLSADIGYTDPDHIPCGSSISGDSLTVAGGTVTTVNGIRLTGDYIQTGGSVKAGFLEAQNVTVSDGILNAQGYSGIQPHYADPNAGGIHGIFARKNITVTGGTVTAFSGIVGHNGDYHSTSMIDGETITTHGLYALESISITGGTVTSTGCVGGYVIDEMGALTRGEYSGRGPAPGAALEAPQWSISDTATFICGSDTSHRDVIATCVAPLACQFCGVERGDVDASNHASEEFAYTANEDGTTHKKARKCCGETVDEAEAHSFDANGKCACGVEAQAKIGETFYLTFAEAATKVTEGGTIHVLTDVTIGADETVAFAAFATLDVAEGKSITCSGTVTIGEADGIIFENKLYYLGEICEVIGSDIVGINLDTATPNTYYPAGEGYAIYEGNGTLRLHNAVITTPNSSGTGNVYAIYSTGDVTIRFSGNNRLTSGNTDETNAGIYVKGDLTLIAEDENAALAAQSGNSSGGNPGIEAQSLTVNGGTVTAYGGSTDGSANYGINVETNLTVSSGTVYAYGGSGVASFGVSAGFGTGTITVADGAALYATGGEGTMSAGVMAGTVSGNVNATIFAIVDETNVAYSVMGNGVVSVDTTAITQEGTTTTFTVPEGTSLTVNSGVTLDLSALTAENIKFLGTIINNGTILLPDGFGIENTPKSGTVTIGDKSYTWNGEKWICDEDSHTGGTATCTEKAECEVCGASYGDTAPGNHASEEFTYTANEDGLTHKKDHECCGATVVEAEAHSFDANGKCACGASDKIISVNITWSEMSFTYTDGEWQPESHTYSDGAWTPDEEDGNVITVQNNGNMAVDITFAYNKTVSEVEGSFTDDSGNAVASSVALAVDEEKKFKLLLSGKPNDSLDNATLGSITVTIALPSEEEGS